MKKLISALVVVLVMVPSLMVNAYYDDYSYYGNNYSYFGVSNYDVFFDVNANYPYYDSISWMKSNDVVSGYEGGYFRPDICVNRAEFLKMMYETESRNSYFDYPYYTTVHYSDVMPRDWFYPYVVKATYDGVVRGYIDGTFKPANCVTRAEAIKVASLYFNNGDLPVLRDYVFRIADNDFRQWYYPFVDYASRSNTVGIYHAIPARSSYDNAYIYLPNESMTRGEVAEMLYRFRYIKDRNDTIYVGGRRDGSSNGSGSTNLISCEIDLRQSVVNPRNEDLRVDYQLGSYASNDSLVRVQLNLIYPNNNELELRDINQAVRSDYTYNWNGRDDRNRIVANGNYEMQLLVRDRSTGRTLCSDKQSFRVRD